MVLANPPLAEPVTDPGGVINKPPFEMGVANFENIFSHEGQFEVYNNEQRLKELKAKYQNILERR